MLFSPTASASRVILKLAITLHWVDWLAIHQFVRIGTHAYIGGKSAVTKDIPPFVLASGDRARLYGLNLVGLRRKGFSNEVISALKKTYRLFARSNLSVKEALKSAQHETSRLTGG